MPRGSNGRHAIMVRDFTASGRRFTRVLAKDIPGRTEADRIVSRLASSYDNHGADPGCGTRWFRDGAGLHQIWVQARARNAAT